jgi:hypothetical protein
MPEARSKFLHKIIDSGAEPGKSFSKERQLSAQAFNLHVERRDGRQAEGFAWSHYVGYEWKDEGDQERLTVVFGERVIEIEGHNLGVLVSEIRDGQLNGIRELASGQNALLQQANPENQPIISGVRSYPDFDEIVKQIKRGGASDDKGGHAGRIER